MSWSKINNKNKKPILWWYHKLLCEFGWWLRNNISYSKGDYLYYKNLNIMLKKYNINLYGQSIINLCQYKKN